MSERRDPPRPWRGRVALAAGSTLGALLIAELALVLLGVGPARYRSPRALESADKRWALDLYPDDPRGAFPLDLRDPATLATWTARVPAVRDHARRLPHAVGSRFTDGLLCRGEAIPTARPRVVVLGDSFTEGQGVVEADTFAARLDARVDGAVIACGRRGLDFPALSARFEALRDALAPDLVVYAMVLNDPVRSQAFHARQRFIDDWIVARRQMIEEGDGGAPRWPPRLVQLVRDRIESAEVGRETTRWYQEMVGPENAAGWRETITRIEAMHRAMQGRFLVVLWPLLVALDDYPFDDVHRTIGDALRARGIAFVDARPAFVGEDETALWVHPADRHPNAAAHARFARAILPALRLALEAAR